MRKLTIIYLVIGAIVSGGYIFSLLDFILVYKGPGGVEILGVNFTSFIYGIFITASGGIAAFWLSFYEYQQRIKTDNKAK